MINLHILTPYNGCFIVQPIWADGINYWNIGLNLYHLFSLLLEVTDFYGFLRRKQPENSGIL